MPERLTNEQIDAISDFNQEDAPEKEDVDNLIFTLRSVQKERNEKIKEQVGDRLELARLKSEVERLTKEKADGIAAFYEEHDILPLDSPERKAFPDDWSFISHEVWKRDPKVERLESSLSEARKAILEDHAYKSGTTGELVCVHCHRSHPNTVEHIPHFVDCIVTKLSEGK